MHSAKSGVNSVSRLSEMEFVSKALRTVSASVDDALLLVWLAWDGLPEQSKAVVLFGSAGAVADLGGAGGRGPCVESTSEAAV